MLIVWITLFSLLGSIGAIIAAAAFLLLREKIQKFLIPCLVSYATGTLLAAALLGLLSHAIKDTSPLPILSTVLVGIVIFFLLEKFGELLAVGVQLHQPILDVASDSPDLLAL